MNGYVGIDPGATGAIAVIWEDEFDQQVIIDDCPGDERALAELLMDLKVMERHGDVIRHVLIEHQQSFPKQGVASTFKLGVNYGSWLMALAMLKWPAWDIRPADWKRGLGYPPKEKDASKEHSLKLARRLYPSAAGLLTRKKDHNRAEALLLAHLAKEGRTC